MASQKNEAIKWLQEKTDCKYLQANFLVDQVESEKLTGNELHDFAAANGITDNAATVLANGIKNYLKTGKTFPHVPLPDPEGREIWEKTLLTLFGNQNCSLVAGELLSVADGVRAAWIERFGKNRKPEVA